MLIALDYDSTYLADQSFWNAVIESAAKRGHRTILTSLRAVVLDEVPAVPHPDILQIVCTDGKAKHGAVYAAGHCPSVWIDAMPRSIIDDDPTADAAPAATPGLLALDYDDTYTRDPAFWDRVIELAKQHGHAVVCATMRHKRECAPVHARLGDKVKAILPTGRKAKIPALSALGLTPTVWIDDQPSFLFHDAYDPEAEVALARPAPASP